MGQLKKVAIRGGASFSVCPLLATLRGGSWGEDNFIYFSASGGPVQRVSIAGGTPEPATTLRDGERNHRWVHVLPGGKAILYTAWLDTGFDNAAIYAESLITHERELVVRGGSSGKYVASGHVIYARPEGLIAVPFDARTLKVTGPPRPVVERVAAFTASGYGQFSVSTNGVLVYEPGAGAAGDASLVWVDRKGAETPVRAERARYQAARLSPDGRLVALEIADSNGAAQIWAFDQARGTLAKLTFEGTSAWPVWTPDGARVTYMSARSDGTSNVYWRLADGSGVEERLTTDKNITQWPMSWSGDGKVLTIEELGGRASYLTMDAKPARHPMLESNWNKDTPRLSWDGKWLAYASAEAGQLEITVQPFPTLDGKHLILERRRHLTAVEPRWTAPVLLGAAGQDHDRGGENDAHVQLVEPDDALRGPVLERLRRLRRRHPVPDDQGARAESRHDAFQRRRQLVWGIGREEVNRRISAGVQGSSFIVLVQGSGSRFKGSLNDEPEP